jgi:plastocyanin
MPVQSRTFLFIAAVALGTLLAAGCSAATPAPAAAPTSGAVPTAAVPPSPTAGAATPVPATVAATVATVTAVPSTPLASSPAATPTATQTQATPTAASIAADMVVVNMKEIKFQPPSVTVRVGQAVEWRNLDSAPHTATSRVPQGVFDSNIMDEGDTFRFTPTTAGTTEYWCLVHPEMRATLVVQ